MPVAPGQAGQLGADLLLGERRRHLEAGRADGGGDVREQVVDRGDPDRRQHRLAIGVGVRRVGHQPAISSP